MIKDLVKQVEELRTLSQRKMNARYEEFGDDGFDQDYPDGPIGDPESLVNEAEYGVWSDVLRMLQNFEKEVNERTLKEIEKILEKKNETKN